jgi:hypothetical protein
VENRGSLLLGIILSSNVIVKFLVALISDRRFLIADNALSFCCAGKSFRE